VGTVTDRDIAVRAATLNLDLEQTRVKEVMTPSVVTVSATADTVEALAVMEQAGVSRLLVVGAEDRVVGVLSTHDLPQVPPR
jgi:CBS domain-containing protein